MTQSSAGEEAILGKRADWQSRDSSKIIVRGQSSASKQQSYVEKRQAANSKMRKRGVSERAGETVSPRVIFAPMLL